VLTGLHAIVYSPDAEKVREFFRDVLELPSVDAGGGWPIFAAPPAEIAMHPADGPTKHELYLMCDDLDQTLTDLRAKGVEVGAIHEERWGRISSLRLPDGSDLPIYQALHPRP
jgi:catechol 2,3-dioxygenase-like lactoylglutathione lyase family enzyme